MRVRNKVDLCLVLVLAAVMLINDLDVPQPVVPVNDDETVLMITMSANSQACKRCVLDVLEAALEKGVLQASPSCVWNN
jgi:hypothetical protein